MKIFLLNALDLGFLFVDFSGVCLESDALVVVLRFAGVGGYTYLLEPLWWIGMIISEIFFLPLKELRLFCV